MEKLQKSIFILVNPMVDITKEVDELFLKRYNLNPNSACVYSPNHEGLFEELEKLNPQETIGGSTLNTSRIIQWILQIPKIVSILGAVGNDRKSVILEKTLSEEGIICIFQKVDARPTGRCAVLITGDNRCLCTELGASKLLDVPDLLQEGTWRAVENTHVFYVSGFFFGVSPQIVCILAEQSLKYNKIFVLNIGAKFCTQKFPKYFENILKFTDVVICNEEEIIALYENVSNTSNPNVQNSILGIQNWQFMKQKERIVVVTRGVKSVLFCKIKDEIGSIQVPQILNIKDTNAAGDAFAGGFLAQFLLKKTVKQCIECGIWAASHIVQNVSCNFDKKIAYIENDRSIRK